MTTPTIQEFVTYNENKLIARIEELEAHNTDMLSVIHGLRARLVELDKSNLELAQENKRLMERLSAKSTEKRHHLQTEDTED